MRRHISVSTVAVFLCILPVLSWAQIEPKEKSQVDYFSFVGRDAKGLVGFAIDTQRAKNGDEYFAYFYTAFFADGDGWMRFKGGRANFPNPEKKVFEIVDSPLITFRGSRATGMIISSPSNDGFVLKSDPDPPVLLRRHNGETFAVSSASATATWRGRTLVGRMIREQIVAPERDSDGIPAALKWKNFNGFYLKSVGDGEASDFYFHHHEGRHPALYGRDVGFATWDGRSVFDLIEFKITKSDPGPENRYRWSKSWELKFRYAGKVYRLPLTTRAFKPETDWGTGGFAMSIVEGTAVSEDGTRRIRLEGFGELLP